MSLVLAETTWSCSWWKGDRWYKGTDEVGSGYSVSNGRSLGKMGKHWRWHGMMMMMTEVVLKMGGWIRLTQRHIRTRCAGLGQCTGMSRPGSDQEL